MLQIFKRKDENPEPPVNAETLIEVDAFNPIEMDEAQESEIPEPTESTESAETIEPDELTEIEKPEIKSFGITDEFRIEALAFAHGRNITDDQLDIALTMIDDIGKGWSEGGLSLGMLEVIVNGLNFEHAVETARMEGEIAGRNSQIDELFMKQEDSDGLPHLSGKGNIGRNSGSASSIFDLARSSR